MGSSTAAGTGKASDLDKLIAPEIKNDRFYKLIRSLAAKEPLRYVLEIGSSAGGGSTDAFVSGLSRNRGSPKLFCIEVSRPRFGVLQETYKGYPFVHCYNRSTVTVDQFPSPEAVTDFYHNTRSALRKTPLPVVLDWLQQDIRYISDSQVAGGAIGQIKIDHGIDIFDMVLIDGSEFTGSAEYDEIRGAKIILLDDTNSFKTYAVRQALLKDPMYDLIADDQTLRNGYSAFRRRSVPRPAEGGGPTNLFTRALKAASRLFATTR